MDENREQEFLEHHGIKGQRWGIRRTPEQLGHKVSKLKKKNAKNWIKEQADNVPDWASDTVDNGRNFVADLFEGAADKIRPKKK